MPKAKRNRRILAISPGKRCLGACVMQDGELVLTGVRMFKGKGDVRRARDCVAELVRDVEPGVLVLGERIGIGNSFSDRLYQAIERLRGRSHAKLHVYPLERVKRFLCGDAKATRYDVICATAERYRELREYLFEKGSEREKYWRPMFGAVALAIAYDEEQS